MKKIIFAAILSAILSTGCTDNEISATEKELELRERELALKEKELLLKQEKGSYIDFTDLENMDKSDKEILSKNNNTRVSTRKSTEQLKRELAKKECETPTDYLVGYDSQLTGIYKNPLSLKFNGFKLKFKIRNNASILTYKNIWCKVTFSSNSGAIILSEKFVVSEFIGAGKTINYKGEFTCTNQQFKDTDKYSVEILGADCH